MLIQSKISLMSYHYLPHRLLSPRFLHWSSSMPSAISINLCNSFLWRLSLRAANSLLSGFFVSLQISRETLSLSIFCSSDPMFALAPVNIITITVLCTCLVLTPRDTFGLYVKDKTEVLLTFISTLFSSPCLFLMPSVLYHATVSHNTCTSLKVILSSVLHHVACHKKW